MPNAIKQSGKGPALQVTREARAAGLAEETNEEGEEGTARWSRLADVRVYGFDHLFVVVEPSEFLDKHVAEIVASTARDTGSIYIGANASIRPAGNGCMVSLPGLKETGMAVGDTAPVEPGPDMLVITDGSKDRHRLARDILTIRESQVENTARDVSG